MIRNFLLRLSSAHLVLALTACLFAQSATESNDPRVLVEQGDKALTDNRLHDAAKAFQQAIDIDPSLAKAHERLGVTLTREIVNATAGPAADSDISDRAEDHLKRAIELAPSSIKPLMELSELEAILAVRSSDPAERSDRYHQGQGLLKQVLATGTGKPDLYLKLANLERDEFSPAIQQARSRAGGKAGPIKDSEIRHSLQEQYGTLINDAISNAQRASEMDANFTKPLLMMSRLLEERALIRETLDEYTTDMHAADDWQRQFLSTGSHTAGPK